MESKGWTECMFYCFFLMMPLASFLRRVFLPCLSVRMGLGAHIGFARLILDYIATFVLLLVLDFIIYAVCYRIASRNSDDTTPEMDNAADIQTKFSLREFLECIPFIFVVYSGWFRGSVLGEKGFGPFLGGV